MIAFTVSRLVLPSALNDSNGGSNLIPHLRQQQDHPYKCEYESADRILLVGRGKHHHNSPFPLTCILLISQIGAIGQSVMMSDNNDGPIPVTPSLAIKLTGSPVVGEFVGLKFIRKILFTTNEH